MPIAQDALWFNSMPERRFPPPWSIEEGLGKRPILLRGNPGYCAQVEAAVTDNEAQDTGVRVRGDVSRMRYSRAARPTSESSQ